MSHDPLTPREAQSVSDAFEGREAYGAFTRDYGPNVAAIVRESVRRVRNGEEPVNRVV